MEQKHLQIAIVGAGVVGLTVADILQNTFKHASITLIADKFIDDTVSCVAAGIFRPGASFKGPTKEITKKWVDDSWYHWYDIMKSSEAADAGVMSVSGYIFSKDNPHVTKNHLLEGLLPIYRPAKNEELLICGKGWQYGAFYSTLLVSTKKYLPWAQARLLTNGGKIKTDKIQSLTSLGGSYDLVFNCTGLGAKHLCDDNDLVPLRGQVVKVRAPWLKMALYGDYDTYIIPGVDGVATLGGTRQYDSYNLNVCRHDTAAILERCYELLPALRKCEVIDTKVGLRPHRSPVRVEGEVLRNGLKVTHCYGHGGYGVTTAPGTAKYAVEIALDLLKTNIKHKL